MAATIADLGARVLRRLGVAVVAVADRPAAGAVVSITDIAARALRDVGINPIAAAEQPASGGIITATEIANRVLRDLGINPISAASLPAFTTTITAAEIASRALRSVGVNPVAAASQAAADASPVSVSEIATRALERLEVIAADETPATLDLAAATEKVAAAHEALNAFGLVTWALTAIPARAAEHYVILTTQLLAPTFGRPGDMQLYAAAQEVLRLQALSGPAGQALALAKVNAVQDALAAQGLVAWASTAIPQAHAEDYVALTVATLAPVFGKPVDGAMVAATEARLRRAVLSGARGQALAEARVTAAHEALRAQGVVSWAVSAIPLAYADDYVALIANEMGPIVGKPMDAALPATIAAQLQRAALSGTRGQALAEAKVRAVHDALSAQGVVSWISSAIPLAHAEDYAVMTANYLAPMLGKPMADMAPVEARVRRASMLRNAPALAEQAVMDVHSMLDARGKARWSVFDLPDFVEGPYVMMAANQLAPAFGMPMDPNIDARAMRDLAAVIALASSGERVRAEYF